VAVICLAALSLVAAGCGGDTKKNNDYVDSVNKAQTDLVNNVQKLGSASTTGGDPATAAKKTFSDLTGAIDKFISDLKGVEPPSDVKDLHNTLISEVTQVEDEVKRAGSSLDSKNPQTIITAMSKLSTAVSDLETKMSKTIDDINAKLHS
jgi:hypothetical protein